MYYFYEKLLMETLRKMSENQLFPSGESAPSEAPVCNTAAELKNILTEYYGYSTQVSLLPFRREFRKLKDRWDSIASGDAGSPLNAEFAAAMERAGMRLAQESAASESFLIKLREVIDELSRLKEAAPEEFRKRRDDLEKRRDAALRSVDRSRREVRDAVSAVTALFHELNARLTLHYQALDLARWESYTRKLGICRELETLKDCPDGKLPEAAGKLRDIRKLWQELGAVPREKQHELGPKYYEYTTLLQRRVDDYYKKQRAVRHEAEAGKSAICEEAEKLACSTDWNVTGDRLKELQQKWKEFGNAGRDAEKALYARFRAACDSFFNARNAFRDERQRQHAAGVSAKNALCAAAEKLGSMPMQEAVREARRLRSEFMNAPRAGKQEQALNTRFNELMDAFFSSRRAAWDQARQQREALVAELESLKADADGSEKRAGEIRSMWRELPPAPREVSAGLEARYKAALSTVDKILSEVRRQRMLKREAVFADAMRAAAGMVEAARRGGELPEITMDLTAFPKLAGLVSDIVSGGLVPEMEKAIARNTREFKRLLDEQEAETAAAADREQDLAAELAAAIAGNFGSAVFASREKDRRDIARQLLETGTVDPSELEELLTRYSKVRA